VVEYSNLIFSFLFAAEMLLKIVSDGPFGYIRDGFNVFDGFIVVLRYGVFRLITCLLTCLVIIIIFAPWSSDDRWGSAHFRAN